eukprot:gnl/MRDRNA2_/MRDRNA2_82612_c0_seq1.p1 gnl/MRDRNA2_/MRDRNA2_82612_c0~~gnl/MRDRNA2_/MRDRNA2_82612_c0_seq1.p1  ORF type:complete len:1005 (+),score=173.82 gnl/MRDRNA2_/MRDRNA2_82612_c0_seq1:125-3016(+)
MSTFDKDLDGKLSGTELEGLFRGLESIGFREVGEQVFSLADADRDGLLSRNEADHFVQLAKEVVSISQMLASDEPPESKANKLLELVGDKCMKPDRLRQVLATAQKVLSPGTPPLIPDAQLQQDLIAADADQNGCLSPSELAPYLESLRPEFEAKKAQVQSLVSSLSNPSPENLEQLTAQLTDLDLDKKGLDLRDGSEGQAFVNALSLVSPDAVAALPQLVQAADTNMDGVLSTMVNAGVRGELPPMVNASVRGVLPSMANVFNTTGPDGQKAALFAADPDGEIEGMKVPNMTMRPAATMSSEEVSAGRPFRESAVVPEYDLLQRMSGKAVQLNYDLQTAQRVGMQRLIHDNAIIAMEALEQIAAGETLSQDAAAALLQRIQRDSSNFMQQNLGISSADPEPSVMIPRPSKKWPEKQTLPLASREPQALNQLNAIELSDPQEKKSRLSEIVEIVVFVRKLAPYLTKAARGARALLTSLADNKKAARVIFKNYDRNRDGAITKDELTAAIAPAVAPLYPIVSARQLASAVILPGVIDTDRDGRLQDVELQQMAAILSMGIATAFGDVNGDGNKDGRDLLAVAEKMGSFGVSTHKKAKRHGRLHKKAKHHDSLRRRNSIEKVSLFTAAVRQKLGEVGTADGEIFPNWFRNYVDMVDNILMSIPVGRLKVCILVSGVVAFAFSIYVLYTVFRGYHWMFVQMQKGDHEYPGNDSKTLPKELRNQYGNSTLFLGMLMSTMVCGWVFVFGLLFSVLSVLMFAELWVKLWQLKVFLLFLIGTKLIITLLRSVVIDKLLNDQGFITWPICFACVWVVLMILNFAIGLFASVCRFFILIPAILYRFNTLDDTMVPGVLVSIDPGYFSLLSVTYTSYEQMNPICRSFITSLSKTAHRLYAPVFMTSAEVRNWDEQQSLPSTSPDNTVEAAPPEIIKRSHQRRVMRNKLWLALLLQKNPSLRFYRYQHGHAPEP